MDGRCRTPMSQPLDKCPVVEEWIQKGDRAFRSAPPDLTAAADAYRRSISRLSAVVAPSVGKRHQLGAAWLNLGNVLLWGDGVTRLDKGLRCYDRAQALLEPLLATASPLVVADAAAVRANRGHALLRAGDRRDLPIVIEEFSRGIEYLERLFPTEELRYYHNLAAMYFNLGQAQRAAGGENAKQAIGSLRKALSLAGRLPADNPAGRSLRISILLNLANAHWDLERSAKEAAATYARIIGMFPEPPLDARERMILATVHANRAHVLAEGGSEADIGEAESSARRALDLCEERVENRALAAELALIARRALAVSGGHKLTALEQGRHDTEEAAFELTDLADASLALARQWAERDAARFEPFVQRFFRFGLEVYSRTCPRFLDEFILEHVEMPEATGNVSPRGARFIAWSEETLTTTLKKLKREEEIVLGTPRTKRLFETVERLENVQERLSRLSSC